MAIREPKSQQTTTISVVGRDAARKGRLELTSGNLVYTRWKGQSPVLQLSYQQLLALLEKEIEYRDVSTKLPMPKGRQDGQDFAFECTELEIDDTPKSVAHASCRLALMQPRRVDDGVYNLDSGIANGRRKKRSFWFATISVQAVLFILNSYIEKFLVTRKSTKGRDKEIVVTKHEMREILTSLLKKLDA